MDIVTSTNADAATITLSGWLDTNTAPQLEEALAALDLAVSSLTIDLADLEYSSSAGLRQLVAAHKKMQGNLTICNVSNEIRDILHLAGFDKRLNIA